MVGRGLTLALCTAVMATILSAPRAVATPLPPRCSTHAFRISEAPSVGGGGTFFLELSYENVTPAACTTGGFPGITLLGSRDRKLSVARRAGGRAVALTVRPGARVFGYVSYSETPSRRPCHAVKAVKVYAPGSRELSVVALADGSRDCAASSLVYRLQSASGSAR